MQVVFTKSAMKALWRMQPAKAEVIPAKPSTAPQPIRSVLTTIAPPWPACRVAFASGSVRGGFPLSRTQRPTAWKSLKSPHAEEHTDDTPHSLAGGHA